MRTVIIDKLGKMLQHDVLAKSIVGGESVLRTSFPATPDLCIRFLVAVVVGFIVEAFDVELVGYMSVQVLCIDVSRDTCMHTCIYASVSMHQSRTFCSISMDANRASQSRHKQRRFRSRDLARICASLNNSGASTASTASMLLLIETGVERSDPCCEGKELSPGGVAMIKGSNGTDTGAGSGRGRNIEDEARCIGEVLKYRGISTQSI